MSEAPLIIVGSGPAGLAAARAFRERDRSTPVLMITADRHPAYERPPLTKDYLRGVSGRDELWLVEPSWYGEHGVELRLDTRVTGVDARARQVVLAGGTMINFRDLILATGSRPKPLSVPGGDHPELIYVRDLESGERLRELAGRPGTRVAVIGSGFIGCEAAASLATRGLEVVLINGDDHPHAARLGVEAGARIGGWLTEHDVMLRSGTKVRAVERRRQDWLVTLDDGSTIGADAVVCGGGAEPNLDLARQAGLPLERGGIRTGVDLRTADPHIFAAGDIAYALNTAAGRRLRVEHWGDADRQGSIAGTVAAGAGDSWATAPGFWSGIGRRTLKYTAWGDGYDEAVFTGTDTSWVVWYRQRDELCGVLTVDDDDAYQRGQQLLEAGVSFAEAVRSAPDGR